MFAIGLFASWLGTLCWNEASQRLPTALVGQLIVFETLAALAYALLLRGTVRAAADRRGRGAAGGRRAVGAARAQPRPCTRRSRLRATTVATAG
jgi:hypothetical protein